MQSLRIKHLYLYAALDILRDFFKKIFKNLSDPKLLNGSAALDIVSKNNTGLETFGLSKW